MLIKLNNKNDVGIIWGFYLKRTMLIEKTEVAISIVGAIKKIAIYSGGLEVVVVPCATNLTE